MTRLAPVAENLGAGSLGRLRARNAQLVLDVIARTGPVAQAEIAQHTTLSQATVSNIISALVAEGTVRVNTGKRNGRRANIVTITDDDLLALGVEVSRTHIAAVARAVDGTQISQVDRERVAGANYDDELQTICKLVTELRDSPIVAGHRIVGIGVSLATWVDVELGCIPAAFDWYGFKQSTGWPGAPLRDDLSRELGLPAQVDSDGNLRLLAEARWGAARDADNVVYIGVIEGLTAGLLLDGRLYRGKRGLAGSLGHSTADPSGAVCICGSRGCLETYLNSDSLLAPLRPLHGDGITLAHAAELAALGDDGCVRVITDAVKRLAPVLANVVSVLVPDVVVVGGDLAAAGPMITSALDRDLKALTPSLFRHGTIVTGTLEGCAAAGAAALAFEEFTPTPVR